MMTTVIKIEGSDLSSRAAASIQRHKIAHCISHGDSVTIDLSDVLSISHSYADELFGVFTEAYGIEKTLNSLAFHGASDHVLQNIASVIHERAIQTGQDIPKTA